MIKKKARQKMKPSFLFICLIFVSSACWACDSYEECMSRESFVRTNYASKNHDTGGESWSRSISDNDLLKAIAYKLDEISKKQQTINNEAQLINPHLETIRLEESELQGKKFLQHVLRGKNTGDVIVKCEMPYEMLLENRNLALAKHDKYCRYKILDEISKKLEESRNKT